MNKNRENFIKYSNDLYFHHLLVENERIRTLICQELILDREIVSTKLKNAQQYGKNFYEKKLILDILYACYFELNYDDNLNKRINISKESETTRFSSLDIMKESES